MCGKTSRSPEWRHESGRVPPGSTARLTVVLNTTPDSSIIDRHDRNLREPRRLP